MLFLATYRVKPFLPMADQRHLLELFEKHGAAPGTIAHYVAADASTQPSEAPDDPMNSHPMPLTPMSRFVRERLAGHCARRF